MFEIFLSSRALIRKRPPKNVFTAQDYWELNGAFLLTKNSGLEVSGIPYDEYKTSYDEFRTVFSSIFSNLGTTARGRPNIPKNFLFISSPTHNFIYDILKTFFGKFLYHSLLFQNFRNFWWNEKRPSFSRLITYMTGRCQVFCQHVTKQVAWYPNCVAKVNTLISAIRRVNFGLDREILV